MSDFDLSDIFSLLPKLAPMLPDIKSAIAEFESVANDPAALAAVAEAQKLLADPKLKAAIGVGLKLAAILKAAQSEQPVRPPAGAVGDDGPDQ